MNNESVERTPEQEEIENLKHLIDRLEARVSKLENDVRSQQQFLLDHKKATPRPLASR